jgi:hypothetical protein
MQQYQVMKKAEEKAKVMGVEPVYMFVGVVLLLLSIVGMFTGGPSFIRFIIIIVVNILSYIVIRIKSVDKTRKKTIMSSLFPLDIVIKGK